MTSIAMEMQLPKRDGITFDGNPLDFFPFCRYFETSVANKTLDNNVKRSHLINHCKGGALRAIKDCTAAPDDSGYDTAWKILKKKFGQPHLISQALLKRIIEGPANRAWDISSLSNLAIDMRNSELTLTHMNCETDMNSSETIDKIIVRLLTYIQQKWVSVSVRIYNEERLPNFHDVTDFVENWAEAANSRYGQLVGSTPESDPKNKSREKKSTTLDKSKATTLATQAQDRNKTKRGGASSLVVNRTPFAKYPAPFSTPQNARVCLLCGGNHILSTCKDFGESIE